MSGNCFQNRRVGKIIIRVEHANVISSCQGNAFIHRIVNSIIRFGHKPDGMPCPTTDNRQRVVSRTAINNYMLKIFVCLQRDGLEGIPDCCRAVVANRNDRYSWIIQLPT